MTLGIAAKLLIGKFGFATFAVRVDWRTCPRMNIQELATAMQYGLPVKLLVLNNGAMGMVRQWQEMIHGGRISHSIAEALPDFVALAPAYGWTGMRVEEPAALPDTLASALARSGPVLVEVVTAGTENCFPMLPPGAAHHEIILATIPSGDGVLS